MKYGYIIWDWNGTLLDDVGICIDSMNELLGEYNLPEIPNEEFYRDIFCFPVRDYYAKLGFDFDKVPFEKPALEFIDNYNKRLGRLALVKGAEKALEAASERGLKQTILSASEKNSLTAQVKSFGIERYFTEILGIDDCFAASKAELARNWFDKSGIDRERVVFVGDTAHDFEVAQAVGCDCVLIANGHQSRSALEKTGARVAESISDIGEIIFA
jgi:phosphoglycolate phosphatase